MELVANMTDGGDGGGGILSFDPHQGMSVNRRLHIRGLLFTGAILSLGDSPPEHTVVNKSSFYGHVPNGKLVFMCATSAPVAPCHRGKGARHCFFGNAIVALPRNCKVILQTRATLPSCTVCVFGGGGVYAV